MLRRCLFSLLGLCLAGGAMLLADENVYVKGQDKPIRGKITRESAAGVTVGVKQSIAAPDIVDIIYEPEKVQDRLVYNAAVKAEKDSLDPAKETSRKASLADALKKFEEVAPNVTEKSIKRQIDFKIAMLRVRQVQEDGDAPDKALAKLKDFAKKNPNSWQIDRVMQTLGRMQVDAGDYEGAEQTYTKLADTEGLPEDVRQDAQLQAIQVKIQAGKQAEALAKLKEMAGSLPKGSRFQARARVAEAECLVAETKKYQAKDDPARVKLFNEAVNLVRGVIKDSNDRYVKAVGHNTLGYCYLEQGQPKDALWEFLWVDVVYNQDRVQHAKALYYLWDLFTKEGDAPRAQECREALLAPQFAGLEYQRLVQKEGKTP